MRTRTTSSLRRSLVTVLNADCNVPPNGSFAVYMNGNLLRTASTTPQCACEVTPHEVVIRDAATLSLFDPDGCNTFQVVLSDNRSLIALAYVKVGVMSVVTVAPLCMFDAAGAGCAERDFCDAYQYGVASVGELDADGDGFALGFGHGCDNCPGTANPDQTDSDGESQASPYSSSGSRIAYSRAC